MKKITLNEETDFKEIMLNANCETVLSRSKKPFNYFKVKINDKWYKLLNGDELYINDDFNISLP